MVLLHVSISLDKAPLQRHRTFNRPNDPPELRQKAVAHQLKYSAVVFEVFGLQEFFKMTAAWSFSISRL